MVTEVPSGGIFYLASLFGVLLALGVRLVGLLRSRRSGSLLRRRRLSSAVGRSACRRLLRRRHGVPLLGGPHLLRLWLLLLLLRLLLRLLLLLLLLLLLGNLLHHGRLALRSRLPVVRHATADLHASKGLHLLRVDRLTVESGMRAWRSHRGTVGPDRVHALTHTLHLRVEKLGWNVGRHLAGEVHSCGRTSSLRHASVR